MDTLAGSPPSFRAVTDSPPSIDSLLAELPDKWVPVRDARGGYLHSDSAIWILCPRKHHVKVYFNDVSKPVCLSCSDKPGRPLRKAAEKLFGEPFSKRTPAEGFISIRLRLGFYFPVKRSAQATDRLPSAQSANSLTPAGTNKPTPSAKDTKKKDKFHVAQGVCWVEVPRRRSSKALRASLLAIVSRLVKSPPAGTSLGAVREKIESLESARKSKAIELATSESPIAFSGPSKYTGGLALIDYSGLSFENVATPH